MLKTLILRVFTVRVTSSLGFRTPLRISRWAEASEGEYTESDDVELRKIVSWKMIKINFFPLLFQHHSIDFLGTLSAQGMDGEGVLYYIVDSVLVLTIL